MAMLSATEHIEAPLEQVFDLFTDLEHAAENLSGIDDVEILTDGPIGVGTRWRETRTMWGKQHAEEMEISQFALNDHYTVVAESGGARYLTTFRFRRAGEGTDVTIEFRVVPLSVAAKLMQPLSGVMTRTVRRSMEQDLRDLKAVAEAGNASGGGTSSHAVG